MKKSKQKSFGHKLQGEKVSPGIVTGRVFLFGAPSLVVPQYWIHSGQVADQTKRFLQAIEASRTQLEGIKSKLCRIQGRDHITILDSYSLLLQDELIVRNTIHTIEKELVNAEWALKNTLQEVKKTFSKINHDYIRQRQDDIDYIGNAILRNLMGTKQELVQRVPAHSIVVARDISAAETLYLDRFHIAALVTEGGNPNSHMAIVARSLALPTLVDVNGLLNFVSHGDEVIVDGEEGVLIIKPSQKQKTAYQNIRKKVLDRRRQFLLDVRKESITQDHHEMEVWANMEVLDEIPSIVHAGATGVGLLRSEFLFMDRDQLPSEAEQEEVYRDVLKKLKGKEVILRTFDLGADKYWPHSEMAQQNNPALGLRAVRLAMHDKTLFETQLRAMFKAACGFDHLKICFPLISSIDEWRKIKTMSGEIRQNLKRQKYSVPKIPFGMMIETPSAVMEVDLLAHESDFICVGTNDLIQYTLACDRTNEWVKDLYCAHHPSILRLLQRIIHVAPSNTQITVCGEIASDPMYLWLLMGLGYTRLSMNPASIPMIKTMIRQSYLSEAQHLTHKLMESGSLLEAGKILSGTMKSRFPEYFQ